MVWPGLIEASSKMNKKVTLNCTQENECLWVATLQADGGAPLKTLKSYVG